MKKYIIGLILHILLITSCAQQMPTETPSSLSEQPGNSESFEDVIIKQLAENLGLDVTDIIVVSNVRAEFGDACLDIAMPDVMCAEMITPGRIVVLEANGIQYEYHISSDGSRVQPASFALTWKREGGIAGFCDSLTVFLSGEIYGNQCKSQDGRMGTFANLLTSGQRSQFDGWIKKYGWVTLDESDPQGVADGMTHVIVLYGKGSGRPGKPLVGEIFTWAQDVFQRVYQ